eukprot:10973998-Karenia_brevis.AAC.1
MNKDISLKQRLRLFHAYGTPCAMYGLGAMSITLSGLEKLAIVHRQMLRSMIGWAYFPDESWHEIGSRMKMRLQHVMEKYSIESWDHTALK